MESQKLKAGDIQTARIRTKNPRQHFLSIGIKILSKNILAKDEVIELRALAISVREGGELWIGNKGCRYRYDATITLYGDNQAMKNGWFFDPEDTWLENSSTDTSKGSVAKYINMKKAF